jgi:two-component system KDP operon response regulator KdpE
MVLLADRQRDDLSRMSDWLEAEGYRTSLAEDGLSALRQFFGLHPDIVIVDTAVRDMSGWEVIERIREIGDTPVIVISSDVSEDATSRALRLNVDGFLLKPLDPKELTLRVNAIRDGRKEPDVSRWVYRHNGLVIDRRSCEVLVGGKPVDLTGTEYRLLAYLVDRRGWVVSHDQILANVWGENHAGERNQVKLYMWYLRRKLEEDPKNPKLIKTKRGLGYCFVG